MRGAHRGNTRTRVEAAERLKHTVCAVTIYGSRRLVYEEVIKVCCTWTVGKRGAGEEIISRKLYSVMKFKLLLLLHKKPWNP